MHTNKHLFLMFFAIAPLLFAQERICKHYNYNDAPIQIEKTASGFSSINGMPYCDIYYKNTSSKEVAAVSFLVITFDVLHYYNDTVIYYDFKTKLRPQQRRKTAYKVPIVPSARAQQINNYHNFVIPERVVFTDGTLWKRSDDQVFRDILDTMGSELQPDDIKPQEKREPHLSR